LIIFIINPGVKRETKEELIPDQFDQPEVL